MSDAVSAELKQFIASQISELKSQVSAKDEDIAQLRTQLDKMKMEKQSKASSSRKASTKTSQEVIHRTKVSSSQTTKTSQKALSKSASTSRSTSTPDRSKKTPTKSPSSSSKKLKPPTPKRHPCQIREVDMSEEFKPLKDAFYTTIRVLWGMVEQGAVPPAPDHNDLKEFYANFSTKAEIESYHANSASLSLIAQREVLALKDSRLTRKAGRGMLHLKDIHIMFIHATLAKIGLRRWCPDLTESTDSLLNCACRLAAISAFRQVAAGGAFDNANLDADSINNIPRLIQIYDHYVHFRMADKFKAEQKQAGKCAEETARKAAQTGRRRLRDHRLAFARAMKYPERYDAFLSDIASHSDDEPSKSEKFYVIKKLPYRSDNATRFLRRLDQEIVRTASAVNKPTQFRTRRVPLVPRDSEFKRPPQNCSLDTLSPAYFNSLPDHLKYTLVKTKLVIFLPDAKKSLLPRPHTHRGEIMSDRKFIAKFYDRISAPYNLEPIESPEPSSEEDEEDDKGKGKAKAKAKGKAKERDGDDDSEYSSGIDLEKTSDEEEDEEEEFYEEGEFEEDDLIVSDGSETDPDYDPVKEKNTPGDDSKTSSEDEENEGDKLQSGKQGDKLEPADKSEAMLIDE